MYFSFLIIFENKETIKKKDKKKAKMSFNIP